MSARLSCDEAASYVYAYLDGEIEPRTSVELLRHLETCRRCLGRVEFERNVMEFVRIRGTAEPTPAGLRDRVRRIFVPPEAPGSPAE